MRSGPQGTVVEAASTANEKLDPHKSAARRGTSIEGATPVSFSFISRVARRENEQSPRDLVSDGREEEEGGMRNAPTIRLLGLFSMSLH
jgi:hypothetical protein